MTIIFLNSFFVFFISSNSFVKIDKFLFSESCNCLRLLYIPKKFLIISNNCFFTSSSNLTVCGKAFCVTWTDELKLLIWSFIFFTPNFISSWYVLLLEWSSKNCLFWYWIILVILVILLPICESLLENALLYSIWSFWKLSEVNFSRFSGNFITGCAWFFCNSIWYFNKLSYKFLLLNSKVLTASLIFLFNLLPKLLFWL